MADIARVEYIWLDGSGEEAFGGRGESVDGYIMPRLRSKWRFIEKRAKAGAVLWTGSRMRTGFPIPGWSMDGSSTGQAETRDSDRLLRPVKVVRNPLVRSSEFESYAVLCEVMNRDGSPHKTNTRHRLTQLVNRIEGNGRTEDWAASEQEFTLFSLDNPTLPFGWPEDPANWPREGMHYCSFSEGTRFGLEIVNAHAEVALKAGLSIEGGNTEVMPSQHEYQLSPMGFQDLADQIWLSRWFLEGVAARHGAYASFHPKPTEFMLSKMSEKEKKAVVAKLKKGWGKRDITSFVMNGAGAHLNWSNVNIRDGQGNYKQAVAEQLIDQANHNFLMPLYGQGNRLRMTGTCETAHYDKGTYADVSRGTSLRGPQMVGGGKDRLEDRRIAADHDPYLSLSGFATVVYFPKDVPGKDTVGRQPRPTSKPHNRRVRRSQQVG